MNSVKSFFRNTLRIGLFIAVAALITYVVCYLSGNFGGPRIILLFVLSFLPLSSNPGFKIQVKDTIGSGDSFLAGFLHQLLYGDSVEKTLAFASATGAFIATQAGACPHYEKHQITDLINANSTTKLETQL